MPNKQNFLPFLGKLSLCLENQLVTDNLLNFQIGSIDLCSPKHGRVQCWVWSGAVEHLILKCPKLIVEKCIQDKDHNKDQHH